MLLIVSIAKFLIVIGSPRAYLYGNSYGFEFNLELICTRQFREPLPRRVQFGFFFF